MSKLAGGQGPHTSDIKDVYYFYFLPLENFYV
jgi:hypothetical protein